VGDFGEARIVFQDDFCTKNRGTECIKSPEMISIARASRKDVPRYDRRRVIGTGRPSDIWSLGCLFYELMTGDFLFGESDGDWLSFYYKLTDETKDLFEGLDVARKLDCDAFVEFTQFCLVRDPSRRPNIKSVAHKFSEMQAKVAQIAPREIIPCFHCRFPVASSFIEKYAHS
jgi:serine/threonine protein kinase